MNTSFDGLSPPTCANAVSSRDSRSGSSRPNELLVGVIR